MRLLLSTLCALLCFPLSSHAETSKPAARKDAPAARKAAARKAAPDARKAAPGARKAAPPARKATPPTKRFSYSMSFRGKKGGKYTRTEKRQSDGNTVVINSSKFAFKVWFWNIKGKSYSRCTYNKDGRLRNFRIKSNVRGKSSETWGKQTSKGTTIHVKKGGKTIKKFFAAKSYDATSLDLRLPVKQAGKTHKRRQLMIPRQEVIQQTFTFKDGGKRNFFGKPMRLWKVTFTSKRGTATIIVTEQGWMVSSKFKTPGGWMAMSLIKASQP